MANSKVYYTDFQTSLDDNLLSKTQRLILKAGIAEMDLKNKYVALKIHFGEPGNMSYLRPNYTRVLVDQIKKQGGYPFLTDCNTLYVGSRHNAIEHLQAAYENGFNPFVTNCHVIIGDGLKGTDEVDVPVNGEYIKAAKIGRTIMDADVFISLTHFKMHECTGVGGVLKNIGMGCGSRAGKMDMHSDGKPIMNPNLCIGCKKCAKNCGQDAISFPNGKAVLDRNKCAGCSRCIGVCPVGAIDSAYNSPNDVLNKKIVEYTAAVIQNHPHFHVCFVMEISPYCDCHNSNDRPVVPNVGIFASGDPVALDLACAEMVNKQPVCTDSILGNMKILDHDYFKTIHPTTNWHLLIEHAVKMGLGNDSYELIKVK